MLDFFNLIISDIKISLRKKNESIISILFFIFSILILPLIFQGDQNILKKHLQLNGLAVIASHDDIKMKNKNINLSSK